ncbi:hypothetical protein N9463_02250 [Planktomarina sp.]|jgi:hypothetical protein|nr:hypothetical protein [Planktomarina sp.]MDS9950174.1 hypothetical protein [Planktomarina sp.]
MSIGTYISVTMHASMVGWLLLNGNFESTPREISVTEVSLVSAEMFDIALNNTPPEVEASIETAVAQPPVEEIAPKLSIKPDAPVMDREQPVMVSPQDDKTPPQISEQPEPLEDLVVILPSELISPTVSPTSPDVLEISLKPKPRQSNRITSKTVAPSEPEVDIGDFTRDAVSPQEMLSSEKKPQTATAPEASTSEIITEAEKPSKLPRVAVLAPEQSVRPKRRSIKIKLDKEQPKQTEQTIDPLAAALNEALTGSTNESESEASTESQKTVIEALAPGTIRGMQLAISPCWNLGASSSAALSTTVVVGMELSIEGKPLASSIYLVGYEGGDDASAQRAFETAQRAINDCGAKGFELPADKYSAWKKVEITFNPERMRVR